MVVATGSPRGTFNAQLFASTGSIGSNCQPTGSALVTSQSLVINDINGDTPFFVFTSYFDLQGGTIYAVSIRLISCLTCNNANYWSLNYVNTNLLINDNIYYWNNPYAVGGPHSKLAYEIDGSSIVQIKNKYGQLDITNAQILSSFTDYANGTVVFDVRGWERQQVIYSYEVTSFGNGTFNLIFLTSGQIPRVVARLATTASFASSVSRETVNYSGNVNNDPLILTFIGSASQQIYNAAVLGAVFASLIFTSVGSLFVISMYGKMRQGWTGEKPPITVKQAFIVGFFAVVGWTIVIIIAVASGGVLAGFGI